jgi:hypothetical protein
VREHRAFELAQGRSRVDAELVRPRLAQGPVGSEGIRVPAVAIERGDLLDAQLLAVRLRGDEAFDLAEDQLVTAQVEPRGVPQLERLETQLFELPGMDAQLTELGDVGQCGAAPEPERRLDVGGRFGGPPLRKRRTCAADQPGVLVRVDAVAALDP